MNVSIIIPTKNRGEDITAIVNCILNQTKKPIELIIIDQSDDERSKNTVTSLMKDSNIKLIYILDKSINSICKARNLGVEKSSGNILTFLDDDVILYEDYIEKVVEIFKNDASIYGVGGFIVNFPKWNIFHRLGYFIFYHGPFRDKRVEFNFTQDEITKTRFLASGNMSIRKEVFMCFRFDENLLGYSRFEDIDISYQISKKYKLVLTKKAKMIHNESPKGRENLLSREAKKILNLYYFFYKNVDKSIFNISFFIWLLLGFLLEDLLKMRYQLVLGYFIGCKMIFRHLFRNIEFKILQEELQRIS